MSTTELAPNVTDNRWTCPSCAMEYVTQRAESLEHMVNAHACPTPEQIERALRGEYDG